MSSEEMLLKYKPHVRLYILFYFLEGFIGITAFALFFVPDCCLIILPHFFSKGKGAMKSILTVVGSTGLAVAWLIPILPQKIHGIRIIDLVRWSSPGFFFYYFWIFIPTLMAGIFAADLPNNRGTGTTLFSFLGTIVGTLFIIHKCKEFVFKYPKREEISYAYYKFTFKALSCRVENHLFLQKIIDKPYKITHSLRCRYIMLRDALFKGVHPQQFELALLTLPEQQYFCEEKLLCLAQDLKSSEELGEDLNGKIVMLLFNECMEAYRALWQSLKIPENDHSPFRFDNENAANVADVKCIFLAKRFWNILLDQKLNMMQRAHVVTTLANQYSISEVLLSGLILEVYRQAESTDKDGKGLLWIDLGEQISTWIVEMESVGDRNAPWLKEIYLRYIWMMLIDYSYLYRSVGCTYVCRIARRLSERHEVDSAMLYSKIDLGWNDNDKEIAENIINQVERKEKVLGSLAIAHVQTMVGENNWERIKSQIIKKMYTLTGKSVDSSLETHISEFVEKSWNTTLEVS